MLLSYHCTAGIDDHNDIYISCATIQAKWNELAVFLKVGYDTIEAIERRSDNPSSNLMSVLSAWLRRTSARQPRPSWRVLCEALSRLDGGLSERIAQEHTSCQCIQCCTATLPSTGGG